MLKALAATLLLSASLHSKIVTQDIDYKDGNTQLQGYLAYDDSKAKAPGILIAHQWMGLTDYEKGRARQLAGLGYVAFAADIYGKGVVATDMKTAGELAGKYKGDRKLLRSRMLAALKALRAQKNQDPSRSAAIGDCFGGTAALELARSGADILGTACFHGGLDSTLPASGRIKSKILVLNGANDAWTTPKDKAAFKAEMDSAKVDWQLIDYSGAVHAFTLPSAGNDPTNNIAYNEKADKRSWLAMADFFHELFPAN